MNGSSAGCVWDMGVEHVVETVPPARSMPPADIKQLTVSLAEPWTLIESAAVEFDITAQAVSVRFELPENSAAFRGGSANLHSGLSGVSA